MSSSTSLSIKSKNIIYSNNNLAITNSPQHKPRVYQAVGLLIIITLKNRNDQDPKLMTKKRIKMRKRKMRKMNKKSKMRREGSRITMKRNRIELRIMMKKMCTIE